MTEMVTFLLIIKQYSFGELSEKVPKINDTYLCV